MNRQLATVKKDGRYTTLVTMRRRWFGVSIEEEFVTYDGWHWLLDRGRKNKSIKRGSPLSTWLTVRYARWITGKLEIS